MSQIIYIAYIFIQILIVYKGPIWAACGKQMHVGNTGTPDTGNRHYNNRLKKCFIKKIDIQNSR